MLPVRTRLQFVALGVLLLLFGPAMRAQTGVSTSVTGTVMDPSKAVVPNATVEISNPVSQFQRSAVTDAAGKFTISNVPFNPYHMVVRAAGFAPYAQDIEVRSAVPVSLDVTLQVASSSETVTVESDAVDLLEKSPSFHTDVDRQLFDKLPLESQSSSLSSLVTLASPGIAADSNGLFHGLGDHAENSFSVDGQPITDQQSKVFSNQIPLDSVESMEVISGAPPAEYGEKTSVVINVTTRSGQGMTSPHGSATASYGSFGSSTLDLNFGYGGQNWGNFISLSGVNSGRFLDTPEFAVIHDKGNEENVFDRVDFQASKIDSIHVNLGFTRSWFQNPNSYDNLSVFDQNGNPVGATDQRSQIKTFNIAPSWTRVLNSNAVFTAGGFARRDHYNYYPSNNPLADFSPIQQESIAQDRMLLNSGVRSDLSYVKGIHNVKIGATYQQTFLDEKDQVGIVDWLLNSPCLDSAGNADAGYTDPSQCSGAGLLPNPNTPGNPNATAPFFNSILVPFDLTRGGVGYQFRGHTDVKLFSAYAQDAITRGNWSFNLGLRGDFYNGLASHNEVQPRLGVAYNVKKTNTVLRASYARLMETPFNENLVLSSTGCDDAVVAALVSCVPANLNPGWRNEFHVGLQQAFGKYLVFSGEYIWKYTHNAYDFSILGNTPIFFPIEWHNSKIPGLAGRVSVPNYHGLSALMVFSSVAARFFPPQVGGLGVTVGQSGLPFRIDHDERFNQTTHIQYQPSPAWPWIGFNWRYDSGMVAGAVPFAVDSVTPVDLSVLSADQQLQAGLFCGSQTPTLATPLVSCAPDQYGSRRISIPAPGTENPDHNPPRIAPRHLFDLALGDDNLFHGDKYKWKAQFTVINVTNKDTLYNFLSTFSGTHFVTPRTYTGQLAFTF
jgi:hypothetical protein